MKPGDLVRTPKDRVYLYNSIDDHHRIMVGILISGLPALAVEMGSSPSDVPYIRVITGDGIIGWIRSENMEIVA